MMRGNMRSALCRERAARAAPAFLLWIAGRSLSVEIVCPGCGFSRQLSADRLPSRTVIATCPRCACRFRFQPDSGVVEVLQDTRQEQPAADAPHSAEERPLPASAAYGQEKREEERFAPDEQGEPVQSGPAQDPLPGEYAREAANPWDSAPVPHGWISAFYQTCMRVMFAAQSFFSCLHSDAAQFRPLTFYLVVSVIQVVTERLWTGLLLSVMAPEAGSDQQLEAMLAMLSPQVNLPMTVLLKTGVSVVQLYVIAALLHVTYGFVTGGRSSFGLLFQVIAYSSAPALICIVPVLGSLAGLVWMFACVLVGCRAALGLTWAQTLMGFVPVVLLLAPLVVQIAQSIQ